jgi:hypothetical protein
MQSSSKHVFVNVKIWSIPAGYQSGQSAKIINALRAISIPIVTVGI